MNHSNEKNTILYRYYDVEDSLLYVGITNNQHKRFKQHQDKSWLTQIARATFEHYSNREDAEEAEVLAITKELPKYNVTYHPTNSLRATKFTIKFAPSMHLVQMLGMPDNSEDLIHVGWAKEVKSWMEPHECFDLPWDLHLAFHIYNYFIAIRYTNEKPFRAHVECQTCEDIFDSDWYISKANQALDLIKGAKKLEVSA